MTEVATIVRDALLHLEVQDPYQPVKAVNMADGIRALNLMMRAWEVDGLSMGWQDVVNPSDDLPAPPEAEQAIGYNLAIRLRARYGVTLAQDVVAMATDGLATLAAQIATNTFARIEYPDLPMGVGWGNRSRNGYTG